jgi:hypothetical protein
MDPQPMTQLMQSLDATHRSLAHLNQLRRWVPPGLVLLMGACLAYIGYVTIDVHRMTREALRRLPPQP